MLPPWQKRHFYHFPLIRGLGRTKKPWNLALTTRRKTENPGWRFAGKQSPPRFRTMRSVWTGKISAKEMSEQIGVCAGSNEMQNKSPGVLQPNQQPVHVWYISWTLRRKRVVYSISYMFRRLSFQKLCHQCTKDIRHTNCFIPKRSIDS